MIYDEKGRDGVIVQCLLAIGCLLNDPVSLGLVDASLAVPQQWSKPITRNIVWFAVVYGTVLVQSTTMFS